MGAMRISDYYLSEVLLLCEWVIKNTETSNRQNIRAKSLIKRVKAISKIPIIGHLEGICHSYVDKDANHIIAKKVIHNAKLRNTAICGATETILLHEKIIKKIGFSILRDLEQI